MKDKKVDRCKEVDRWIATKIYKHDKCIQNIYKSIQIYTSLCIFELLFFVVSFRRPFLQGQARDKDRETSLRRFPDFSLVFHLLGILHTKGVAFLVYQLEYLDTLWVYTVYLLFSWFFLLFLSSNFLSCVSTGGKEGDWRLCRRDSLGRNSLLASEDFERKGHLTKQE